MEPSMIAILSAGLHVAIQVSLCVRVLLRPHRQPASRIAWIVVITSAPVIGIVAYLLLGEVNIGRKRIQRMRETSWLDFRHWNSRAMMLSVLRCHKRMSTCFVLPAASTGSFPWEATKALYSKIRMLPSMPWCRTSTRHNNTCMCSSTSG